MKDSYSQLPSKTVKIINEIPEDVKNSVLYVMETGYLTSESCPSSSRMQTDSFFFIYVIHGKGIVEYDGSVYNALSGQCVFLDSRHPHLYRPDPEDPWEVIWVKFNGNSARYYYSKFTSRKCCVFIPQNPADIKAIMTKIVSNNVHKCENTEIINTKLLTDLLTSVLINYCIYTNNMDKFMSKLYAIKDYLDRHFTESINLDSLEERFYISKYYLTREFKKEFGVTIIKYILNKRIEYAKELLKFTDKTIDEISEICGFNDQSYFSKQFKKYENVTCLEYRKNQQTEKNIC